MLSQVHQLQRQGTLTALQETKHQAVQVQAQTRQEHLCQAHSHEQHPGPATQKPRGHDASDDAYASRQEHARGQCTARPGYIEKPIEQQGDSYCNQDGIETSKASPPSLHYNRHLAGIGGSHEICAAPSNANKDVRDRFYKSCGNYLDCTPSTKTSLERR